MSKLNGGLEALGTAMFVSSLGGVGALTLSPPPQPANAAAASNIKIFTRFSIDLSPFRLLVRSTNDFLRNLNKSSSEGITMFPMRAATQRMVRGYLVRLYGSHNGGATENRKVKVIYGLY
ncbi:hypothetical protein [Paraburkholderia haematera]|nr:hypothetical protein [Paraburkholderia haematera]